MRSWLLALLALLVAAAAAGATANAPATTAAAPAPSFPKVMSYSARLILKANNATFLGRHHMDATRNLGRVDWNIFWDSTSPPQPFMLVFFGDQQTVYQVSGEPGNSTVECSLMQPYTEPVFDWNWAVNASYLGPVWFAGQLCNSWGPVLPFFVQGKQTPSTYYADFFQGLPVALDSSDNTLYYDQISMDTPPSSLFTAIQGLPCSSGARRSAV
jgi:hypothetical protein